MHNILISVLAAFPHSSSINIHEKSDIKMIIYSIEYKFILIEQKHIFMSCVFSFTTFQLPYIFDPKIWFLKVI